MSLWSLLSTRPLSVRFVDADGWRTRVVDTEAGTAGEAVVLLHGTSGHLESFARNIGPLAERHRVVAYDLPGHGYTTLATEPVEIADYVRHLLALLDSIGVQRAHLVAESIGAWIAIRFAIAYPDRVGRLVLSMPGGLDTPHDVMERIRVRMQATADDPTTERVRARVEFMLAEPDALAAELVEVRQEMYRQPGFPESMRNFLCLHDPDLRERNLLTPDDLAAVKAPTLVVWTTGTRVGAPEKGEALAKGIAGARFELLDGAEHWPQWDRADRFNELTGEFLSA
ncbi:alpha/beta fold hydrolase [Phytohabitans flavus]|uniref:2-hydroxy-6-ketonona-2,4-dienedioic acid hydrolase n=1 Tax=Phytohabitans flavus TaxID=1076124 RepID=A0A6F8XVN2_9ACTN|nr:alpha/beta fold hydrolase [Phytohabitans flavus]BCB77885.1 2-hydroxy-6-ketonona-2,4-dienedioic acid hydrolase [Phytohabitans flavus]